MHVLYVCAHEQMPTIYKDECDLCLSSFMFVQLLWFFLRIVQLNQEFIIFLICALLFGSSCWACWSMPPTSLDESWRSCRIWRIRAGTAKRRPSKPSEETKIHQRAKKRLAKKKWTDFPCLIWSFWRAMKSYNYTPFWLSCLMYYKS